MGVVIFRFKHAGLDAFSPLPIPQKGEIDHRLDFPSAFLTAKIPHATRFDPPMGSHHAGLF